MSRIAARLARETAALRAAEFRPRPVRLAAYISVFAFMLSLPQLAAGPTAASDVLSGQDGGNGVASERAVPVARSREVLTQSRAPLTLASQVAPAAEVIEYRVQEDDNLYIIAATYHVTTTTIAFNSNITDARLLHVGDKLRIPPYDAAIYTVKGGDTLDTVASYFKVDPKTIMDANRLYFEPDNFAPGKEILVPEPDANYPNFELKDIQKLPPMPVGVIARDRQAPRPNARLAWPVGGVITQYFWYGHKGVDIAAPFGTGIGASDAGVVSAAGWVAVGGLRVCVRHDWGMETCYYHTSVILVEVGQQVARGQTIARIGLTGVTTGPHVHWEARYQGVLVNPLEY